MPPTARRPRSKPRGPRSAPRFGDFCDAWAASEVGLTIITGRTTTIVVRVVTALVIVRKAACSDSRMEVVVKIFRKK